MCKLRLTTKKKSLSEKHKPVPNSLNVEVSEGVSVDVNLSEAFDTLVAISEEEISRFCTGYEQDVHFRDILADLAQEDDWDNPKRRQYHRSVEGLLYFIDWEGRTHLCVPKPLCTEILTEIHELLSYAAHGGFAKTYNRVASIYYWPRMSRDIKAFVSTCDVCQKMKSPRHLPYRYLKSIPIPNAPFEVVTMDFITGLPESGGYNAILVVVDKLTKYGLFIPTSTNVSEIETAKLFFDNVWSLAGMPRQIISDRDARWSNDFWKTLTALTGSRRALTTSHHPQADGQSEVLNQFLEVGLRTYVNKTRNDWHEKLTAFKFSYNTGVHSRTGYTPMFLLCGFEPATLEGWMGRMRSELSISRGPTESAAAESFADEFEALRSSARDALTIAQAQQEWVYNNRHKLVEFEVGDKVLINPHSLHMTSDIKGTGRKLTPRMDGPFEVIEKLSPLTYRLRLPVSYGIHPVINIAHLEPYRTSPDSFGPRTTRKTNRADFSELHEYEVDRIIGEFWEEVRSCPGRPSRRVKQYIVKWKGYEDELDYLTKDGLKNTPDVLKEWNKRDVSLDKTRGHMFVDPRSVASPHNKGTTIKPSPQSPQKSTANPARMNEHDVQERVLNVVMPESQRSARLAK